MDGVRAFALHYTLNPFKINRYYVDFTAGFVEETYKHLDSDDIRDYVCDVMESRCSDTFKYNNFTSSLDCKTAYDNLPLIDEGGYLDGNTKSCRMIHAALASEDSHHCPHISFAPMKDKKGKIKCQESKRQKDSDIFSQYELDTITETGYKLGFPETLYRNCTYNPNMTTDSPFDERPKMLLATGSVPLSYANDGQFQVSSNGGLVFVLTISWG